MDKKKILIWGNINSFTIPLVARLLNNNFVVHFASKSFLDFTTPLNLDHNLANHIKRKTVNILNPDIVDNNFKCINVNKINSAYSYQSIIFCGLPPHYDEDMLARSAWSIKLFNSYYNSFKNTPIYYVSSIWSSVNIGDETVQEKTGELYRKPLTSFEAICQNYEKSLFEFNKYSDWYLVRIPFVVGDSKFGNCPNFTGLYNLIKSLWDYRQKNNAPVLYLNYNPNACLNWLSSDFLSFMVSQFIQDNLAPKICNIVPTQALLNQEWLNSLAQALGFEKVMPYNFDDVALDSQTRKFLNENIQIKMRNLYEIIGRYKPDIENLDKEYFKRVIDFGVKHNWNNDY